jgi:VCBS repeat-containing protein
MDVYLKEIPGPATPTATAEAYSTPEDTALTVAAPGVLANDGDTDAGDSLRASVVTGPSHGTLALATGGGFTYTPASNYAGPDSFTYRASDGSNGSAPATVSLTVTAVNDRPVATAGADQTVAHDADFTLHGGGTDADGGGLTYAWTQVSGPVAVIRDPDAAETVVDGVPGAATLVFRLTVTDPSGATSTDEVTVKVNPK